LLGEHFVYQGMQFASAYVGTLLRQQQTAERISAACAHAGVSFPALNVDPGWDEFDLADVYREIAPHLAEDDSVFRSERAGWNQRRSARGKNSSPVAALRYESG
jgi:broad specificity phosphatase PhoE